LIIELLVVAAVVYWRYGSVGVKEQANVVEVVRIPAFARNSSGKQENHVFVTCWCADEKVNCGIPRGLIPGSEEIICNPDNGYDFIDGKHCRFEYDLYDPTKKLDFAEPWRVDVAYAPAGNDGNPLGGGLARMLVMYLMPWHLRSFDSVYRSEHSGRRVWGSGNSLFYPDPFKVVLNQAGRLGRIVSGFSGKVKGFGQQHSGFHKEKMSKQRFPRFGHGPQPSRPFSFRGFMLCIGLVFFGYHYLGRSRDSANLSNSRRGHGQATEFGDQRDSDRSAETDENSIRAAGNQNEGETSSSQRREACDTRIERVPRGVESSPTLAGEDQPATVIGGEIHDTQTDQADGVESPRPETQVENEQGSTPPSPPGEDPEDRQITGIAGFWRRGGFFNLLVFLCIFEIVLVLLRTGKLHDLVLGLGLSVGTYKFVEMKLSLAVWEAVRPSIEIAIARSVEKLNSFGQWSHSVLGDAKERFAEYAQVLHDYFNITRTYAYNSARSGQSFLESQRRQLSVGLAEVDITMIAAVLLVSYVVYQAVYRFAAWELLKLVGLIAVAYFAYQLIESGPAGDGRVDRAGRNPSMNTGFRGFLRRSGRISRRRRRW